MPVLENFGFRVMKETPTRLEGGDGEDHIHEFAVVTGDGSSRAPVLARAGVIEAVVAAVLEGRSRE